MGKPLPPIPVKLFLAILSTDNVASQQAAELLENKFGSRDFISKFFDFTLTNYYVQEMGPEIKRWFWSFERLIDPARLPEIKLYTNSVETILARSGKRMINLDPGYLDFHKVILASVKDRAQKIYLSHGIYADPTLYYLKGHFICYEWALPDFKTGIYNEAFLEIRRLYKNALRMKKMHDIPFIGFNDRVDHDLSAH